MINNIAFLGKWAAGKTTMTNKFLEENPNFKLAHIYEPVYTIFELLNTNMDSDQLYNLIVEQTNRRYATVIMNRIYPKLPKDFSKEGIFGEYLRVEMISKLLSACGKYFFLHGLDERLGMEIGAHYVIDDLFIRYDSTWLRNHGFTIVKLVVDDDVRKERIKKMYGEYVPEIDNHKAYADLEHCKYDVLIANSGDAEAQYAAVKEVLANV